MLTTVLAVILGIILVSAIHPGRGDADSIHQEGGVRNLTTADTLMDLVRYEMLACTAYYIKVSSVQASSSKTF
jgi:Na+/H+-dicarboxylate symporter